MKALKARPFDAFLVFWFGVNISGAYSGALDDQGLDISSNLPPTDEFTDWLIQANAEDVGPLCAWSGSDSCADVQQRLTDSEPTRRLRGRRPGRA